MNHLGREVEGLLLRKPRLPPYPLDHAQSFAQRGFEDFGLGPAGSRGANPHLTHQGLIDRKGRLHSRHMTIFPCFPTYGNLRSSSWTMSSPGGILRAPSARNMPGLQLQLSPRDERALAAVTATIVLSSKAISG